MINANIELNGVQEMSGVTPFVEESVESIPARTHLPGDDIASEVGCPRLPLAPLPMHQVRPMTEAIIPLPLSIQEIKLELPFFEINSQRGEGAPPTLEGLVELEKLIFLLREVAGHEVAEVPRLEKTR